MKIAIHVDGPRIRGNERQVIRIAAGLHVRGHDVVVSCRKGGPVQDELTRIGVRTTGIRPRGDGDLWNALRFAAWLRRERVDAVLLTSWKRAFIGTWAARLAGVPRLVFRLGGVQPLGRGLRGLEERHSLRVCHDAIIANARAIVHHLTESIPGLDPSKVQLVPNGIEPTVAEPEPLRDELRLPEGDLLVAAVGGLERNKGFDLLIDAVGRLDADVHAVLIGGGTRAQRQELDGRVHSVGAAERVHFLGPRENVAALLAACDLFVLSSRSEGMSVAMLEAMAAGKPVIAFDVGGTAEALGPEGGRPPAGWVVPAEDAGALAHVLAQVAGDLRAGSGEVCARVAEARWRIENWFDVERMVDGYERVLAAR